MINNNSNYNKELELFKNKVNDFENHAIINNDTILAEIDKINNKKFITIEHLDEIIPQIETNILSSIEQKLDIRFNKIANNSKDILKSHNNEI